MKLISRSAKQTQKIGAEFAKKLVAPAFIGLKGDLGSGKTTFVQGMARGLGINPNHYVNSPTFTMVNEYGKPGIRLRRCEARGFGGHRSRRQKSKDASSDLRRWTRPPIKMIHVDLYRIGKPVEGETLALEEYLVPGNIVVVEWVERMPVLEGELDFEVFFEGVSERERKIEVVKR